MYSVTIGIKSKDGLLSVIDWVLRTEGLTLAALKLDPAGKVKPAKGAGAATKRPQLGTGVAIERLLTVVKATFGDGSSFNPKQVSALAVARGVPKGSVYGGLVQLANQGKLHRPAKGFYALVVEKKPKE